MTQAEDTEDFFLNCIAKRSGAINHSEPIGLKEMCKYIIKLLNDETRYGKCAKDFKGYYDLASQYPNNIEEISHVFAEKYIKSMTYGFVSSSFLETIMSEILTKEELEKANKIIDWLKDSGLSLDDYFQTRTEYDSSEDLFDQLSLVDSYVYYEMRKYEIQLKNDEMNRIIDANQRRNNRISKDPQLWLKM